MVTIRKGEVSTFKMRLNPEAGEATDGPTRWWLGIQEGEFAAPAENGLVPWRVTYDKRDQNVVYLTVDARPSRSRPSRSRPSDAEDPNGWNNVEFQLVPADNVVDCTLSIDLGNTRTVALLVDQVGESVGRLPIYMLPMKWAHYPTGEQSGTFESVVSLIFPDLTSQAFCGNESRASFVKLGKFAVYNNRAVNEGYQAVGRWTLSSPKRYFWDEDPARRDWIGVCNRQKSTQNQKEIVKLDGRLAQRLGESSRAEPNRLPPASILSAMVAELYEQACYYVGSREFKSLTRDDRCRRITKVHVTYPSTLLPRERAEYEGKLREGLMAYAQDYPSFVPTLCSDIDEASSVLSVYAYSEMRKSSALSWLQSIGRQSAIGGYQARVAVIDVGGGTTDLSISSVEAFAEDAGVDPFKASLDLVCRDGVNRAGDALMFEFIRTCVAALGFDAVWNASGVGEGALSQEDLRTCYRDPANEGIVRDLTRSFWFDLAIRVAAACDETLRRFPAGEVDDADFHPLEYTLSDDARGVWNRLFNKARASDSPEIDLPEKLDVRLTRDVFDKYLKAVDGTFRRVARSFANLVYAYDADVLLFSGKTAEFFAVQQIFKKFVALPDSSVKSMKDFEVGTWCGQLTDDRGRISDSKVSTALGGALYSLRDDATVNLSFKDLTSELACQWGFVADMGEPSFTYPIFAEGESRKEVPMGTFHKLIARQAPFSSTAILSYELRFKPGVLDRHGGLQTNPVTVQLNCNPARQELSVESCTGTYNDLAEVRADDLECRICTMNGEFAMDKIVEI